MKNKAQIVEEILSIKKVDTKANLMKLSLAKLESILSDLEDELVKDTSKGMEAPRVDVEALKEQLKQEMLAELKEQALKELEAEPKLETSKNVKQTIDRNYMVPVMNATNGYLIYQSKKTGTELHFQEYGDIEYVDYQELLTMKSGHRRFFDEPFIIVLDDEAANALSLTKMYENIPDPSQIDKVFQMNQKEFENVVEKAPRGIKHVIILRAKQMYESGVLDSVKKINYLNDRFKAEIGQRG